MNVTTTFSRPEELLSEISPRVSSVNSLLRFKCLSKWWCSFISTEKFTKNHLECTSKNALLDHHNAIIISKSAKRYVINYYPVGYWFCKQSTHCVVQFGFDYPETDCDPRVVGFCNGLCCILVDGYNFVLWNPSTRKSHILPALYEKGAYDWIRIRGFGYDESNDDYKLKDEFLENSGRLLGLSLLEHAEDFVGRYPTNGVLVKGKLHWGMDSEIGLRIVAFDVGSESGGLVEEPRLADGGRIYLKLGVLQGCLCLLRDTQIGNVEVWIMKKYGLSESWC